MGLTTSLFTALSGLNANSQAINVAGNNISNANTTAFKASRPDFETQILQTFRDGTSPTADRGGVNPTQIGLGTRLAGTTRLFENGTLQLTGVSTDMAIEGSGFFVVQLEGNRYFSRDGSFSLDNHQKLVNSDGGRIQGYGVDSEYNIVPGDIGDIAIPVGTLTLAEATRSVRFSGNLKADGTVATGGSRILSAALFSDAAATVPAAAGDGLTSLFSATGSRLFSDGDVIRVSGVTKGGSTLPTKTFHVGAANTTGSDDAGSTLQDLLDFYRDLLGIDTTTGGSVGVTNGQIDIQGNSGTINDLSMAADNVVVNATGSPSLPFTFTKAAEADGESVRTSYLVYDSLGSEVMMELGMVLEERSDVGTTWRFYAQSEGDSDLSRHLGSGTIRFDTSGRLISTADTTVTLDRAGTGALSPQQIELKFDEPARSLSALASGSSQIASTDQDGSPIGSLSDFTVSEDGKIVGVFSNGLSRTLGQIALAKFVNDNGLTEVSSNLFAATSASGDAAIVSPTTAGAGRIVGQALELSNVDLSQEFINLITATTGFTANSRVFTTSDRLIQELLTSLR